MIGAVAANVVGNVVSQPLLGPAGSSPTVDQEIRSAQAPIPDGYASSAATGVMIGVNGRIVVIEPARVTPEQGEGVPVNGNGERPAPTLKPAENAADPDYKPLSGTQAGECTPGPDWLGVAALALAGAAGAEQWGKSTQVGALAGAVAGWWIFYHDCKEQP